MGKHPFTVRTNGHCFFCLKETRTTEKNYGYGPEKVFSLRNICQYLKVNLKEILSEAVFPPIPLAELPNLEQSELEGTLCQECAQTWQLFSRHFLQLEAIQMKLQSCLKSLHGRMEDVNPTALEEFNKKMLGHPETFLQYGIVKGLRRKTLEGCSELIDKASPRVLLKRIKRLRLPTKRAFGPGSGSTSSAEFQPTKSESKSLDTSNTASNCSPGLADAEADPKMDDESKNINSRDPLQIDSTEESMEAESSSELKLMNCDICRGKVSDLSSHLYQAHYVPYEAVVKKRTTETLHPSSNQPFQTLPPATVYNFQLVKPIIMPETKKLCSAQPSLPVQSQDLYNDQRHKCEYCDIGFDTEAEVATHVNVTHFRNPSLTCEFCSEAFDQFASLYLHRKSAHLGKKFQCTFCSETFSQSLERNQHMKNDCGKRPANLRDFLNNREK